MATDINDLLKSELAKNVPFKPYCDLCTEADTLTVFYHADAYFSRRLTDHVTLFLAMDDPRKIVGCRIKGIEGLMDDLPNYIAIDHGPIRLSLIILAFRGSAQDQDARDALNEIAKGAGNLELQPG